MIKLFSKEEFINAKSTDLLPLKCEYCEKIFYRPKKEIKYAEKPGNEKRCRFCSQKCGVRYVKETVLYKCDNCKNEFHLQHRFLIDGKHHFCSKSCAASYNNKHKKYGTRVSRLEKFIAKRLQEKYPDVQILLNDKETIGSELDFYIPGLKLAFEINGITHYKPIYGEEKFQKIVKNDLQKQKTCKKLNIKLFVIDVSSQKYYKEETSEVFLNEIISEIDKRRKSGEVE